MHIYYNQVTHTINIDNGTQQIEIPLPKDVEQMDVLYTIQSPVVREIVEALCRVG